MRAWLCIVVLVAGCYLPEETADSGVVDGGAPMADGGGLTGDGLPCDVDQLVADNCRSCHRVNGSAPMPLVSRVHFTAATPSNASTSVGSQSVTRMKSATAPMPPSGQLSAAQIQVLDAWVTAGMPEGTCGTGDAGVDPFEVPPQCTSNTTWTRGNSGSSRMNPGRACLSCHAQENDPGDEEAPEGIGGTLYPTAHEPDLCNGLPGAATVVLTGSDGREFRLSVNDVGNFHMYRNNALLRPYTARVEFAGRTRRMSTPQMSGDCNSCHTQAGTNGAPGRILAP